MRAYIGSSPVVSAPTVAPVVAPATVVTKVTPALTIETVHSIPTAPYYLSFAVGSTNDDELWAPAINIVYVIGCGGTGGFVIRELTRYISTLPYADRTMIVLIDGDTVEKKNLTRQNFVERDLGKNKAAVLAQRYGQAFGVTAVSIPEHLTKDNIGTLLSLRGFQMLVEAHKPALITKEEVVSYHGYSETPGNVVIISCVDNHKTRSLISTHLGLAKQVPSIWKQNLKSVQSGAFYRCDPSHTFDANITSPKRVTSLAWIDSGNEARSGQVFVHYDSFFHEPSPHFLQDSNDDYKNLGTGDSSSPLGLIGSSTAGMNYTAPASFFAALLETNYFPGLIAPGQRRNEGPGSMNPKDQLEGSILAYTKVLTHDSDYLRPGGVQGVISSAITGVVEDARKEKLLRDTIKLYDPLKDPGHRMAEMIRGLVISNSYKFLRGHMTPPVTYMYPDVFAGENDKLNTELSCAEQALADPQTLMVNVQAAAYVMDYVSRVLASNPKTAFLDSFGCAWNGPNCKEFHMTRTNIEKVLESVSKCLTVREDESNG
jgi:hypothetical protein